jgi:hypothetical protein
MIKIDINQSFGDDGLLGQAGRKGLLRRHTRQKIPAAAAAASIR